MSDDLKILAEDIVDFLSGVEACCVRLKRQIENLLGTDDKLSWNPNNMEWVEAEGSKGRYERSEDVDSPDFRALVKDLAAHNGTLSRRSYFYWLFKNGATVGRKKRGRY